MIEGQKLSERREHDLEKLVHAFEGVHGQGLGRWHPLPIHSIAPRGSATLVPARDSLHGRSISVVKESQWEASIVNCMKSRLDPCTSCTLCARCGEITAYDSRFHGSSYISHLEYHEGLTSPLHQTSPPRVATVAAFEMQGPV